MRLPKELKKMLRSIAREMKKLEQSIRAAHVSRVKAIQDKEKDSKANEKDENSQQKEEETSNKDGVDAKINDKEKDKKGPFVDEFGQGENNIYVDELSDDDVAASKADGLKQRGLRRVGNSPFQTFLQLFNRFFN